MCKCLEGSITHLNPVCVLSAQVTILTLVIVKWSKFTVETGWVLCISTAVSGSDTGQLR